MNPKRLSLLASGLLEIANRAKAPAQARAAGGKFVHFEGVQFVLDERGESLLDELIRDLMGERLVGEKFAERTIVNRLYRALTRVLRNPTHGRATRELQAIIREVVAYNTEQTVYIPVIGVELEPSTRRYPLGNVTVLGLTTNLRRTIRSQIFASIRRGRGSQRDKKGLRTQVDSELGDFLSGKVVLVCKVVAEPARALERGEEEARRSLELLRFARPAIYGQRQMEIGLVGEASSLRRPHISVSAESFLLGSRRVGALHPFMLGPRTKPKLRKLGVPALSELLCRRPSELNDFEESLLSAVHWFSTAQVQKELENALQCLITSIECLLTPKDGNPIGSAISEGGAMVLSDTLEGRKYIKKRLKAFYKIRSGVSHGGNKVVLETDYRELELAAGSLLVVLTASRARFKTRQQLLDRLEEMKLTGSSFRSNLSGIIQPGRGRAR